MPDQTETTTPTGVELVLARQAEKIKTGTTQDLLIESLAEGPANVEITRLKALLAKGYTTLPMLKSELNRVAPIQPAGFSRDGKKVSDPIYDDKGSKRIAKIMAAYDTLDNAVTTAISTQDFGPLTASLKDIEQNVLNKQSSGGSDKPESK